ncbi:hypothetical protein GGR53DRAFT_338256 [Hypoxylon sp. FL1150]|nr:hypothetical protein GGR53DRAFT_338256 [Hypoxylon sp. FL1150]
MRWGERRKTMEQMGFRVITVLESGRKAATPPSWFVMVVFLVVFPSSPRPIFVWKRYQHTQLKHSRATTETGSALRSPEFFWGRGSFPVSSFSYTCHRTFFLEVGDLPSFFWLLYFFFFNSISPPSFVSSFTPYSYHYTHTIWSKFGGQHYHCHV